MKSAKIKIMRSKGDWALDVIVYVLLSFVLIVTLYPVIHEIALSFSSSSAISSKSVWLYPIGFNVDNYKLIVRHEYLPTAFLNSLFYTACGTSYSMCLTILGAYALSRKKYFGRDFVMMLIAFTMLFNGGLIPTYLLIKNMGLCNTRLALIIPMAISQYYMIVMRTSMQAIPPSIEESAKIDGANDFTILFRIIVPMSVPVIATIALFYGVLYWNDFFAASIYLNDKSKYPLQLIARELIVTMEDQTLMRAQNSVQKSFSMMNLTPSGFKAAIIVVLVLPLMAVYPFIQKYFAKGIMVGAIKE